MIDTRECLVTGFLLCALCLLLVPRAARAAGSYSTRSEAQAACLAYLNPIKNNYSKPEELDCGDHVTHASQSQLGYWSVDRNGVYTGLGGFFAYAEDDPPDYYCEAGQVVPPGTDVLYDSASGAMCTIGVHSCALALNVGGDHSGTYTMTGDACGSAPAGEPKTIPDPPEPEPEPGGGQKACDEISGTCVTTKPPDPGPPAPPASSGGPNDTTTTTGQTTTPGSTTITNTTTTTTTTGGGTGGDGGPASSSSSTAVTQHPATTSSTSSKCTGGACDVGNADGVMGAMYRPSAVTPAGVYQGFAAQVAKSPMITAVAGFFSAEAISGTCPTWHIPGNKFWGEAGFDFSFFCQPGMLALLALAGYLVLAVGAFNAFRIALY